MPPDLQRLPHEEDDVVIGADGVVHDFHARCTARDHTDALTAHALRARQWQVEETVRIMDQPDGALLDGWRDCPDCGLPMRPLGPEWHAEVKFEAFICNEHGVQRIKVVPSPIEAEDTIPFNVTPPRRSWWRRVVRRRIK